MYRTHTCGELNESNINEKVSLSGWVHSRRDHGGLIFIDLRDAYGITQVVFDPKANRSLHDAAHALRSEYVVRISGTVRNRPDGTVNKKITTGMIEIVVDTLDILNESLTPPFEIDDTVEVSEETRLKYRYIDLRKPKMQSNLRLRHKIMKVMRDYLDDRGFIEIETPILTKSTPEGARDYLVPSRLNPGRFYALPQSPQLFKQILMVAGSDRYFQIARCFRDEDLRADRQPEFTQLDIEMSFVTENDIYELCEGLLARLFKEAAGIDMKLPFKRLKYQEAMDKYGTDKPDTRIPVELSDVTDIFKDCGFNVFKNVIKSGGRVKGFSGKGCADMSLSKINELTEFCQEYGAKGLAWLKIEKDKVSSPIRKFFKKEELDALIKAVGAEEGDIIFLVADKIDVVNQALGALRVRLAKEKGWIDNSSIDIIWIVDFPLFKYNADEKRWESEHHPFTSCHEEDISLLDKGEYDSIRSRSYDLVINGMELASGSIRIHSRSMQEKMFKLIGISEEESTKRFGFLMEAFKYGAPPHGGIAFGLDRFLTLFTKSESIRDVIAFPKTQKGVCHMTQAPSDVDDIQLRELHIKKGK